jgi:hypothetical protein
LKNEENIEMLEGMGSCHGVLDINGILIGDPLEIKMFEKSGWKIVNQ